jgi:hypothetical protein
MRSTLSRGLLPSNQVVRSNIRQTRNLLPRQFLSLASRSGTHLCFEEGAVDPDSLARLRTGDESGHDRSMDVETRRQIYLSISSTPHVSFDRRTSDLRPSISIDEREGMEMNSLQLRL